ncbi:MAG: glutathione peroxidase [Hyphomicrobiaceae bacterium]|nr:glutathione peroxidase [Hyphomicrobiaceae bacterium]
MKRLSLAMAALSMLLSSSAAVTANAQDGRATDFSFTSINGKAMPLSAYAGKVLLVVNTASFCGYTRQYEGLQRLWERYEAAGLVVIGVPSNDFSQEPKGDGDIAAFCQGAFGVTFPLTTKTHVTGSNAHPLYRWIDATLGGKSPPGWNFHKYLISADGRSVTSFPTTVSPDHRDLIAAIERELAKRTASGSAGGQG